MMPPAVTHPARAIRLIAARELTTRLRTRSFLLGTLVIIAVIGGFFLLQVTVLDDAGRKAIGLTGQATNLAGPIEEAASALGAEVDISTVAAGNAAAMVRTGELDAVVSGNAAELTVLVEHDLDPRIGAALQSISRQEVLRANLAEAGVADPARVLAEADATAVAVTTLEEADPERDQRTGIGLVIAVLLFMSISSYGTLVAQGVIEEKASRVVEILLATVRPWQLLFGKVLGLGLVGLTQIVIIAGVGLTMAAGSGALTLSGVAFGTLAWGLLWYVLGFFLYATVFAAAGSLVSRQEDAQSVLTPVTLTLTIGFVVGFNLLIRDPDGTASVALSLVPVFSPILMPARIAAGSAAGWEIALAIVLSVGAAGACTWLASRIYRNAVLRTGSRLKLADALRG